LFSASTFVVKIATFAKRQNVIAQCKKPAALMAHLVFPIHKPTLKKPKQPFFSNAHQNIPNNLLLLTKIRQVQK